MGLFQYISKMAFSGCSGDVLSLLPTIDVQFGRIPFLSLLNLAIEPEKYIVFLGSYCIVSVKPAAPPADGGRALMIDAADGIFDRVVAHFDQPKQRIGLCTIPPTPKDVRREQQTQMRASARFLADAVSRV